MVKLAAPRLNIIERKKAKQAAVLDRRHGVREFPKDKGQYLGSCNRSACLKPGAYFYNHGSLAYYCRNCAFELNHDAYNRMEAMDNWGHLLCTEGEYDREKFEKEHELHRNAKRFAEKHYLKGQLGRYLPDADERWSSERVFTVCENTPKDAESIAVKFLDGKEAEFPMRKVKMSERSTRPIP